jgi:hypothetical protein
MSDIGSEEFEEDEGINLGVNVLVDFVFCSHLLGLTAARVAVRFDRVLSMLSNLY